MDFQAIAVRFLRRLQLLEKFCKTTDGVRSGWERITTYPKRIFHREPIKSNGRCKWASIASMDLLEGKPTSGILIWLKTITTSNKPMDLKKVIICQKTLLT